MVPVTKRQLHSITRLAGATAAPELTHTRRLSENRLPSSLRGRPVGRYSRTASWRHFATCSAMPFFLFVWIFSIFISVVLCGQAEQVVDTCVQCGVISRFYVKIFYAQTRSYSCGSGKSFLPAVGPGD